MNFKLETITPDRAKQFLEKNNQNRNLRQSVVASYANEMSAGRWLATGDPIRFFEDGSLADGQHRLNAVISSGVTVQMWVLRGVGIEAMAGIDMGAKRTVADFMHLHHDLKNANLVCASCRSIYSLCFSYQNFSVSPALVERCLDVFGDDIATTVELVGNWSPSRKAWIIGSLAFGLNGYPKLVEFIARVGDGERLSKGEPAYALRNWLISKTSGHLSKSYKAGAFECVFNAMNAALVGTALSQLKSGQTGINIFKAKQKKFIDSVREEVKRIRP